MSDANEALANHLASAIFNTMLDDILMDIGQRAHKEVYKSRNICNICHTRCRSIHPQATSDPKTNGTLLPSDQAPGSSRPSTPLAGKKPPAASGANTPNGSQKPDILFNCPHCNQPMASNRFAPHLAKCLGLNGARRVGARNVATKTKLGSEGSRANTPSNGVTEDQPPPPPPVRKGRPPKGSTPKGKKKGASSATPEVGTGSKRPASPASTPPKNKKLKGGTASPSAASKGLPVPLAGPPLTHKASYPKIPSRLRASSTSSPAPPPVSLPPASPQEEELDLDAVESPESVTQSPTQMSMGTPDSYAVGRGSLGSKSVPGKSIPGKSAPPGYVPPKPAASMSFTAHNDPDYVGLDADDLADTDSSGDDGGGGDDD